MMMGGGQQILNGLCPAVMAGIAARTQNMDWPRKRLAAAQTRRIERRKIVPTCQRLFDIAVSLKLRAGCVLQRARE